MSNDGNINIQALFEGDSYSIYRIDEGEGEVGFDLNLFGTVTIHFLQEEWEEFIDVMNSLNTKG